MFLYEGRLEQALNIFATIHKSIFSGEFYEGIPAMPGRKALQFLLVICLSTAIICGFSHLYYALDPEAGLAAETAGSLGGIEITNGVLNPHRTVPYIPDNLRVSRMFELLFCLPRSSALVPDSFVVVDTSAKSSAHLGPNTMFLLTARRLIVNPGSQHSYGKSYTDLLGKLHVIAEKGSIQKVLLHRVGFLALFYCVWTGVSNAVVYLLSIAFLSLAAYIFRLERSRGLADFLKMACFAGSPVYVGTNIVALSGTSISWTWQVTYFAFNILSCSEAFATSRNPPTTPTRRREG